MGASPPTSMTKANRNDEALYRLLQEAPYLARCSHDKTAKRIRPREYAIHYPYMQVNRRDMRAWLVVDLDHPNALIWDDEHLAAPNLIVRNRHNGHAHLYYAIRPVCISDQARSAPIRYMRAVYTALTHRLHGDLDYNGPVAKTPGHPMWLTTALHPHEYTLGELADGLDLPIISPWRDNPRISTLETVPHSRNCRLFHRLRHFAYSIVDQERTNGSFHSFTRRVQREAQRLNTFIDEGFHSNLRDSELRATAKSVSRWTWEHYRGATHWHHGAMALDRNRPLKERQRLAALRTHSLRRRQTEAHIEKACRHLHAQGQTLTFTAIAAVTGLTRQTVAAYRHLLNPLLPPPLPLLPTSLPVKLGVHQIAASPFEKESSSPWPRN